MANGSAGKDCKEHLLEELQRAERGLGERTLAAQSRYQNALHAWDREVRRGAELEKPRI